MSNGKWFVDNKHDKANDPDGSGEIQSIATSLCQFSTGQPVTIRLNGIKVTVTEEKSALFSMEDDDGYQRPGHETRAEAFPET
jgi:hypothetical protein